MNMAQVVKWIDTPNGKGNKYGNDNIGKIVLEERTIAECEAYIKSLPISEQKKYTIDEDELTEDELNGE